MILHSFKSTWVQRRQCNNLNCYIKLIGYPVNWSSKEKSYVSGSEKLIFLLEIKKCWRYWTGLAVSGGKRNSFNKGPSAELFFVPILICIQPYCVPFLSGETGWSVTHGEAIPIYWLARARSAKVWRRVYWFHWASTQDKRAIWPGWTHQCSL